MLSRKNDILIIDAKYYASTLQHYYATHKVRSEHLYQIFAYVKNKAAEFHDDLHRVSGMVLYAATQEEIQPDFVYQMRGNQISIKTLDLGRPFIDIANCLDRIVTEHFHGLSRTGHRRIRET